MTRNVGHVHPNKCVTQSQETQMSDCTSLSAVTTLGISKINCSFSNHVVFFIFHKEMIYFCAYLSGCFKRLSKSSLQGRILLKKSLLL